MITVKTWKAQGAFRYRDQPLGHVEAVLTRTYVDKPTPQEVRSDIQGDALSLHGTCVIVDRIAIFEMTTEHIFDA